MQGERLCHLAEEVQVPEVRGAEAVQVEEAVRQEDVAALLIAVHIGVQAEVTTEVLW